MFLNVVEIAPFAAALLSGNEVLILFLVGDGDKGPQSGFQLITPLKMYQFTANTTAVRSEVSSEAHFA